MKILNISAAHPLKIAGIVAYDFHKNMLRAGYESKILTLPFDNYDDENIIPYFKSKNSEKFIKGLNKVFSFNSKINAFDPNYYFNGSDLTKFTYSTKSIIKALTGYQPDLIVIQFAQSFLSPKNIYELNRLLDVPVYWYLMDMGPLTGGCAYAWGCSGYKNSCGTCPAIFSNDKKDISAKNLAFKKEWLDKMDLTILTASSPHYRQSKLSSVFSDKPNYQMFLAIDENIYSPVDLKTKLSIRAKYGISRNKRALFFGAVKVTQKRKGLDLLFEALKIINNVLSAQKISEIELIIAGNLDKEIIKILEDELNIQYVSVGFLNHEQLPEVFSAVDCFICPSIQDSGPMMVNQSIMTGTPVISFNIGVAEDLVHSGKTGFKAQELSEQSLALAIQEFIELSDEKLTFMSLTCRQKGLSELSYQAQRERFAEIINHDKNELINKLEWDTTFFGMQVGEAKVNSLDDAKLKSIFRDAKKQDIDLLYLRLKQPFVSADFSFEPIDEKITYTLPIRNIPLEETDKRISSVPKSEVTNDDLIKLSHIAGKHSRYNLDKNIPNEKFLELYTLWITNSVSRKFADNVLVYRDEDKILGMVTIKIKGNKADIGLISVFPNNQGKGLGKKLLMGAVNYSKSLGKIFRLDVVTQATNVEACAFYSKFGFEVLEKEFVYHLTKENFSI